MFEGQPRGFPLGDFDLADVMLPEEDDMGIPSGSDEEQEEEVQTDSGFQNVLSEQAGVCSPPCCFSNGCSWSCLGCFPA
jgi:hypothetical protein